jgi:glutaredoxin
MNALMYSKLNCPFCNKAEALLTKHNYKIEKRMIEDLDNRKELLARVPSAKSVPQIFLDENYIGGYTQLEEFLNGQ